MRGFLVLMVCGLTCSQGNAQYQDSYDVPRRTWASDLIYLNPTSDSFPVPRCQPEHQTITLGDASTRYVVRYDPPTTNIARRCGGSCGNGSGFCKRDTRRVLNVVVSVTRYDEIWRRWGEPKLESVPVEDHTACKCVRRQ